MAGDPIPVLAEALAEAQAALRDAEANRAHYEVRVDGLRTEIEGLKAAIARRQRIGVAAPGLGGPPSPANAVSTFAFRPPGSNAAGQAPPSLDFQSFDPGAAGAGVVVPVLVLLLMEAHKNWAQKKRASAVELVLLAAKQPVHRADITETLRRVGRPKETVQDVSAALTYLQRTNRVRAVGDGFWTEVVPLTVEV